MSQENVELVREAWKAYKERGLGAASEYFAEDCLYEDFPEMPDGATYTGMDGLLERTRNFGEMFGDWVMEPVEYIDAGGDTVVAVIAMTGWGKGGGVPLDAPAVFVYELRDSKIVRDRACMSRAAALKAVGLAE